MKTHALGGASAIALLIALSPSQAAFAQQAPGQVAPQADAADSTDRVIVTGSRIAVETGAEAPTPVSVVGLEELQNSAQTAIVDSLIEIPALRGSATPSKGSNAISNGSFLNLRNLGTFRNLVLLDGKRFVTQQVFGGVTAAVNIEAIPSGLVQRVDTVTGGASAAYGSDAVAGVVNFILDKEYEGIKGEVGFGQTDYGDNMNYSAKLTAGGAFAEGRGHMLFAAEYSRIDGIAGDPLGEDPQRPWLDEVPAVAISGGRPGLVYNSRFAATPPEGVIWAGPLAGTTFDASGNPIPYNYGTNRRGEYSEGGDGWKMGSATNLAKPSFRSSIFGRISYDLDDDTNVYLEMLHADSTVKGHQGYIGPDIFTGGSSGIAIKRDNAYVTPALGALMDANSLSEVRVRKIFDNVNNWGHNVTDRVVLGLDGRINDDWTYSAYGTYGVSKGSLRLGGDNPLATSFFYGTDAVRDTSGNIVCRIKLTDPNNRCVPINLLGTVSANGAYSAAQKEYFFPEFTYFNTNTQSVVEASVSGSLFELPAGTVSMATGVGYRHEDMDRTTDTRGNSAVRNPYTNAIGAYGYLNQPGVKGALEMWEGFAEVQVPLLADLPFVKSLDANLAGRRTEYSTSGGVDTWKAGLVYEPFDGLRLRGTISRDVRAAGLPELFTPPASGYSSVSDPFRSREFVAMIPITLGNRKLTPEEADTQTVGVVYRPDFLPDFYASIDYYKIEIAGQIATLTPQRTIDLCFQGLTEYCGLITRGTPAPGQTLGQVLSIQTPLLNLSNFVTSGIDVEAGYETELDLFGTPGDLSFRFFGTHTIDAETTPPGINATKQDTADGVAQQVASLSVNYKTGPLSLTLQENWVSGGRFSFNFARFAGDRIKGQTWADLTANYELDNGLEFFGSVQNIFDRDPPVFYLAGPVTTPFNGNFDLLGRRYLVGFRFAL